MKPYVFLVGDDADLPRKLIQGFPIKTYSFSVSGSTENFYEDLRTLPFEKTPTTSQPSVNTFVEKITGYLKSYQKVIVVTISSELSGTYNSALQASKSFSPEEQKRILVIDSGLSTAAVGISIVLACQDASQEKADVLQKKLQNAHILGTFEDSRYIERGGRINKIQALLIQNVIKGGIRPILCIKEKKIGLLKVSRPGSSKVDAISDAFSQILQKESRTGGVVVAITHGDCLSDAQTLADRITTSFPQSKVLYIHELAPALGVHLGPGALVLSYVLEDN